MGELAEAGCLELTLTGGEPFARPDFFEIYDYAKEKGFLIIIFSNGTLITEKIADRFAINPPERIEISFHGLTERSFEAITKGAGSYHKCLEAIRLLLERRIPLVLKSVAMTVNKDEVLAIKKFSKELGPVVYHLGEEIRMAIDGGEAPFQYQLSEQELETIHRQDPAIWKEACCKKESPVPVCQSARQNFHIDAYGQLQRCSGNRLASYDLRSGSFKEGFYRFLQDFPCPAKCNEAVKTEIYGLL